MQITLSPETMTLSAPSALISSVIANAVIEGHQGEQMNEAEAVEEKAEAEAAEDAENAEA